MNGYICYFEAYSVPLQQPKDYLCVQYIGCPKKLRLLLMVIYVYVQKQRNHLGLTPAIGASPNFSLPLEKFSGQ